MSMPRLVASTAAGLVILLHAGCDRAAPPAPPRSEAAPRAVQLALAELRPLERSLNVVGSLAAREEALVAAQVAGQIEHCAVDLGDVVAAGQELARIDTAAYEARLRQSAANLERARAAAANARQNLARIRELQTGRIASASDLDQALAEAQQREAEVKAAEAELAMAQLNLDRSRVKAPFAGAIAARPAGVGDYVAVGAPIVRLVETSPLRLRLDVPERESALVRTGLVVRVRVEGDPKEYSGTLTRLAPAIREADRMLAVEADVPNPGSLRVGLFARAQIIVDPAEPALCIPADALVVFAGLEKVVVAENGRAVEKTITTGRRAGDWVEVLAGLTPGEQVVREPAGLRTGQPLTADAKAR
ncbi:MAG: efflux RND transporter periplasmic adaptor subunit [Limisphaerales bacterium]